MGRAAAPIASDYGSIAFGSPETMPGVGSSAEVQRGRGLRRKLSREAVVAGWMALEGTIIGYGGFLAIWLRQEEVTRAPAGPASHCGALLLASILAIIALKSGAAYDFARRRPSDYNRRAVLIWMSVTIGLWVAGTALALDRHFAVRWATLWLALATVGLTIERSLVVLFIRFNQKPVAEHRVVIMPALRGSLRLAQRLNASAELGLKILGFVDERPIESLPSWFPQQRVIGDTRTLLRMIRGGEVDEVVLAIPWTAAARIQRLLVLLSETPVRVSLATGPIIGDFPMQGVAALGGVPVVRLSDRPIRGMYRIVKKIEDVILAAVILILAMPLLILVMLAIKLDSPGAIFFCQPRLGFNGQPFNMLKFRTMHAVATDLAGRQQAMRDDPRVTRVGAWLRRSSFDELPQLINVLRGEMSLVGPRPHAHGTTVEGRLFHEAVSGYAARHRVKPGITGWAQVNGWRGETDVTSKLEERLRHDLHYIDKWSLWLDCVILARTLLVPFRRRNAY
jgi:Undecaprenyl-phosphate glucose phosphotransferase